MAYPPGFLFPPPLSSCPSVVLGPRAGHEGSAFAPYSASGPHAPYGAEPRAAAAISAFLSPAFEASSAALDFHPFSPLGPCHPYADPAYRKNATRDATATLKAWLNEHRKNPYPTKGEKIMLAIITKMTLTQVSTWFANARRRLKKENKMTWTPRNRSEDEEEPEDLDPERPDEFEAPGLRPEQHQAESEASVSAAPWFTSDPASSDCTPHCSPEPRHAPQRPLLTAPDAAPDSAPSATPPAPAPPPSAQDSPKPKLWSLAEIATSSDTKNGTQRTPFAHGSALSRPLYVSPAYVYQHYAALAPGLQHAHGLYSRPDRDLALRTCFGAEKQDKQLLVPP